MKNDFNQRRSIYPLRAGEISGAMFHSIIDISSIRSEKVINALHDYFVKGETRLQACEKHDVNVGYLSIKIKELQSLNKKIISIHPYYEGVMQRGY